jgi:hypothetical protein
VGDLRIGGRSGLEDYHGFVALILDLVAANGLDATVIHRNLLVKTISYALSVLVAAHSIPR